MDSMQAILFLVMILAIASPALAAPKSLGKFGDWAAFVDGADKRKVCYVFAVPKKAEVQPKKVEIQGAPDPKAAKA